MHLFNGMWYLFYLGGVKWFKVNERKECLYKLKVAVSADGLNWSRSDRHIIPSVYEQECQTCATVFQMNGKYNMYFTYRHSVDFRNPERGYRIGYAVSDDLLNWTRMDESGNFDVSKTGWDSEMVCYPNVSNINGTFVMLYCGNSFGLSGFGYAELMDSE